jgi:hypothetical protein
MLCVAAIVLACFLLRAALGSHSRAHNHARDLLTPADVNTLIARHWEGVRVAEVAIVAIAHCGDGKASTTDRVELKLTYENNRAELPSRMLLKMILLPSSLRIGSTAVVQSAAAAAKVPRLVRLDGLVYAPLNLFNYYFPHAPDVMYETEAKFYAKVRPELDWLETPQVYGSESCAAERRHCVQLY